MIPHSPIAFTRLFRDFPPSCISRGGKNVRQVRPKLETTVAGRHVERSRKMIKVPVLTIMDNLENSQWVHTFEERWKLLKGLLEEQAKQSGMCPVCQGTKSIPHTVYGYPVFCPNCDGTGNV